MAVNETEGPRAPEKGAPRSQEGRLEAPPLVATVGLVAGVLGLTALAFGLILYVIDPDASGLLAVNLVFAVSALVFYLVSNRGSLGRVLSGRSTPLILIEVLLAAGVAGAVVAVNFIASGSKLEWDLTRDKQFTLQEHSAKVAASLKAPVKVIGFYKPSDGNRAQLEQLVELYRRHTDRISLETYNPDAPPPALVKKYQMSVQSPRIVVATEAADGERHTKIRAPTEEELTNALIRVADRPRQKVVFLTGHGEPSISDTENEAGYKRAAQALGDLGFVVSEASLIDKDAVPEDANVVVLAGPKTELFPNESTALAGWFDRGGRLLVLVDPGPETGVPAMVKPFGVDVGDNLIVDPNPAGRSLGFGSDAPVVMQFEQHAITAPLKGKALLFYWARSVTPAIGVKGTTLTTLIQTSAASWGESKFREGGDVERDEADVPGPVPIAVAVHRNTVAAGRKVSDEARMVVIGDSSFMQNRFFPMSGNGDLFLNAVSWLAGEENRIAIRPRQHCSSSVAFTQEQQYGIVFFSVNLLPLLLVGLGFSVWAVRRRK